MGCGSLEGRIKSEEPKAISFSWFRRQGLPGKPQLHGVGLKPGHVEARDGAGASHHLTGKKTASERQTNCSSPLKSIIITICLKF